MLVAIGVVCVAMLAIARPAAAHGGPGLIDVGEPETVGELQIEFPVRITYENDGHAAEEVEGLTVSGKGPDGAELAPTEAFVADDAPGVFRATVTLPVAGQWELTIDVVEPPATATIAADVAAPEVEEPNVDDGAPGAAPDVDDEAPDAGAAPDAVDGGDVDGEAGDDDAVVADDTSEEAAAADDDSGFPWLAVVIALIVAGGAAVVGFRLATRRGEARG